MTGNVADIDNIWALLALLVVLGVPASFTWLNSRTTRRTLDHETKANSGSTLKDALNRLEAGQAAQRIILDQHTVSLASQDEVLETIGSRVATLETHEKANHPDTTQ
ncbi:MAG TPA: hypothetical protein VMV41_13360 [Cellulomonadaceae bacterium]|nr:hypothetical protein [Cellulomonadaceae bacterium]